MKTQSIYINLAACIFAICLIIADFRLRRLEKRMQDFEGLFSLTDKQFIQQGKDLEALQELEQMKIDLQELKLDDFAL